MFHQKILALFRGKASNLLLFLVFSFPLFSELTLESDFESLCGKFTECWEHIAFQEEPPELQVYKSLYEKNKELQFQKLTAHPRVPSIIHFIWLGPKNFPLESIKNVRAWMQLHPDFTFLFWTDRERPCPCPGMTRMLVQDFPFTRLKNYFESSTNYGEKSDLLRYEILAEMGGIYVDHDVYPKKSFAKLNQAYDFYAGLEVPHKNVSGHKFTILNALIGTRSHHPILERCIDIIDSRWDEVHSQYSTHDQEFDRIINGTFVALTLAAQNQLEKDGNLDILFPASYFCPFYNLPSFYAQHLYEGNWMQNKKEYDFKRIWQKEFEEMKSLLKKFIWLEVISLILITFLFFRRKKALLFSLLFLFLTAKSYGEISFEEGMGKNTSYWNEVKIPQDFSLLSFYQEHYLQKEIGEGIPKTIHFLWMGNAKIPSSFYKNIQSWTDKHPFWKVKLWTDQNVKKKIQEITICSFPVEIREELEPFFELTKNIKEKEELMKQYILLREGGVFIDGFLECKKSIEELCKADFYVSLMPPHESALGLAITPSFSIIGSIKGHPIIEETVRLMKASWVKVMHAFPRDSLETALYRASNRLEAPFQEAIISKIGERDRILPAQFFYKVKGPGLYGEMEFQENYLIKPKHLYEDGDVVKILQLKKKLKTSLWGMIALSFCIFGGAMTLILKKKKINRP